MNENQEFRTKEEIVECLVNEWGYRRSQFYNNETNKSIEKSWTFGKCLDHLNNLRRNYVKTEHGLTLKVNHIINNQK
jgi:hypothetical protein